VRKAVVNGEATPEPGIDPIDRLQSAEVIHYMRDHLGALSNALRVVRLAAGSDPRMSAALDLADRQATCLAELADRLHEQGQGNSRKRRRS
jgi:hypothetical protein